MIELNTLGTTTGRYPSSDLNESSTPQPAGEPAYHDVAVVGAGFSGIVTAINILRLAKEENKLVRVILLDPNPNGKGVAYSTLNDNLLLNVPASNMSAFPGKPSDFKDFCLSQDSAIGASSFMPRRMYGEYLGKLVQDALVEYGQQLERVVGVIDAIDRITTTDDVTGEKTANFVLEFRNRSTLTVDSVVLTFGHQSPRPIKSLINGPIDMYSIALNNPWDEDVLSRVPHNKPVLLLGTGHTAIDVLAKLESDNPARPVYMVSRRGLMPNGHRPVGEFVKDQDLIDHIESEVAAVLHTTPTARAVFKLVRALCRIPDTNWRDVINALRTITPMIWDMLPVVERNRLLRQAMPFWDVHRHRISPLALRRLEASLEQGRAAVVAGYVEGIRYVPAEKVSIASIRLRGTDQVEEIDVGATINCTGPSYDISRATNTLINNMYLTGMLTQDESRIGFETYDYRVHKAIPNLFYVGPMLKATFWEAIAVPELRVHSLHVARALIGLLS